MIMLTFHFAAHHTSAGFNRLSHHHINIVKGLQHQQAEIQDQYGGNDFHSAQKYL